MADPGQPKKVTTPIPGSTNRSNQQRSEKFVLTEEEKAVLLDCRTKSISRGLPLAIAGVLTLRYLHRIDRLHPFIKRHRVLFYIGVFGGCFTAGVNSYRSTCIDNIMRLENSRLADQLRNHMEKENMKLPEKWNKDKVIDSIDDNRGNFPPSLPQTNTIKDEDQPPDAFGSTAQIPGGTDPNAPSSSTHGRTFDEIREENRRKQLSKPFPRSNRNSTAPSNRPTVEDEGSEQPLYSVNTGKGRAVKRNKYGDIIYDDD